MSDSTSSGSAPQTPTGLDATISKIGQRIENLDRIQASSRRFSLIVLVIVALEFAAFALMTRSHVEANFNDQDIQKAIADRLPDVTPEMRDQLVRVTQHALPIYRQQAMARIQVAGPAVAKDAMSRLEKLPEENGEEMHDRLDKAFAHAIDRLAPDIRATYPSLSDDRKTEIMKAEFQKLIDAQNEVVAKQVTGIYVGEQESTRAVLDKFDIPGNIGTMSPTARQRGFLHALVDVMMDGDINVDLSKFGPPAHAAGPDAPDTPLTVLAKPAPGSSSGN